MPEYEVHPSLRVPIRGQLRPLPPLEERSQQEAEEGLARQVHRCHDKQDPAKRALSSAVGQVRWLSDVWTTCDDPSALLVLLQAAFDGWLLPRARYERALRIFACRAARGVAWDRVVEVMERFGVAPDSVLNEWMCERFRVSHCLSAKLRIPGGPNFEDLKTQVTFALTEGDAFVAASQVCQHLVARAGATWLVLRHALTHPAAEGWTVDESTITAGLNAHLSGLLRGALGNPFADLRPPDILVH